MPAYKDEKSKKWYVSFYVKENGISKKVKKMGFSKKQEAMEYERNYINSFVSDTEIIFENLCKSYMNDLKNRLKLHTIETKKYLINKKILPFFQKYKIKEITPLLVRKWQNELMEKNYAQTYLRTINNQLVAILNYAVKFYNLKKNPCLAAGTIGKKNADEMNKKIIANWNNIVKANDEVYILGDVTLKGASNANTVLSQLKGKKYLIKGNHDHFVEEKNFNSYIFEWVKDYYELEYESNFFVLFHYPLEEWNKFYRGAYQLHGHQHNNSLYNYENLQKGLRRYDVGVDANNFKPVSIDEIIKFFEMIKEMK